MYVAERRNFFVRSLAGGRMLSRLMLPWFRLVPPRGFGALTTKGRRSGKTRRTCVRAIRDGHRAYLVSIPGASARWLTNVRADPSVSLRLHGGHFTGRARELTSGEEMERARSVYCGALNAVDYLECVMHRRGRPTRRKIEALHRNWFDQGVPLVVELEH